ncbi:GxxExxY protein [Sphingomonas bacterium]|uniref:GxxExxY protein n=1 Tax=Sphingomonas bacterium TaxID=1895847 RepID=UPI0015750459|nr:GxxExxY protein [Sphingomonas bacterium]
MRDIDEVSGDVLDVALRLHRDLGPGLLESVYETVLADRLRRMGYVVERQRPVDIEFEGVLFAAAFKADLIVDGRLVVEIKSIERLLPVHGKQLLTYLRLLGQPVGLLINFGGDTLKEGVKRVVNSHSPSSSASPRLRVNQPSSGA